MHGNVRRHVLTKTFFTTALAIPLLIACSQPSGVSRLLPTNDTRFVASARPVHAPAGIPPCRTHKTRAGRLLCKRQHWFRYRIENVGEKSAFALCHLQAFAGHEALRRHVWSPYAGRNAIDAGDVVSRTEMTVVRTTRPITRYALSCRSAMWTNGAPV